MFKARLGHHRAWENAQTLMIGKLASPESTFNSQAELIMLIVEPGRFSLMDDDELVDGVYITIQRARMQHALDNLRLAPSEETVALAAEHIAAETGIILNVEQLLQILSLYPVERVKLAKYGWGDAEVSDLLMTVLADFIAGTRWPEFRDQINIDRFVGKLRCAARGMGFTIRNA